MEIKRVFERDEQLISSLVTFGKVRLEQLMIFLVKLIFEK